MHQSKSSIAWELFRSLSVQYGFIRKKTDNYQLHQWLGTWKILKLFQGLLVNYQLFLLVFFVLDITRFPHPIFCLSNYILQDAFVVRLRVTLFFRCEKLSSVDLLTNLSAALQDYHFDPQQHTKKVKIDKNLAIFQRFISPGIEAAAHIGFLLLKALCLSFQKHTS